MIYEYWTFRPPPQSDELLSSYLVHIARQHGLSASRFCALFWSHHTTWARDLDRGYDSALLEEVARLAHLSRPCVQSLTLQQYQEILAGGTVAHGTVPFLLAAGVFHRTRQRHFLQYCPGCLAEGRPFFRRAWRLGFVVFCETHRLPLRDACPHCAQPIVPHRAKTLDSTTCYACEKSLLVSPAGEVQNLISERARNMQASLLQALEGTAHRLGQDRLEAGIFFRVARSLISAFAARDLHIKLRYHWGLSCYQEPNHKGRAVFELCRHSTRTAFLETLSRCLEDWPRSFFEACLFLRLTQRHFFRLNLPAPLADQVVRLPAGNPRPRHEESLLDTPEMKRLRRRSPLEYRQKRARLLLPERAKQR